MGIRYILGIGMKGRILLIGNVLLIWFLFLLNLIFIASLPYAVNDETAATKCK